MEDDEGMMQEYKVRAYKYLRYKGTLFDLPDVRRIHTSGIYPFDIKIESYGYERTLKIFYNSYVCIWKLASKPWTTTLIYIWNGCYSSKMAVLYISDHTNIVFI